MSCERSVALGCRSNQADCIQECNEKTSVETCEQYNTKAEKCNEGVLTKMNAELESCFVNQRRIALNSLCSDIKKIYVPLGLDHSLIIDNSTIYNYRY